MKAKDRGADMISVNYSRVTNCARVSNGRKSEQISFATHLFEMDDQKIIRVVRDAAISLTGAEPHRVSVKIVEGID